MGIPPPDDVAIIEAVRTPGVDLSGALSQGSPSDLGIKVVRAVLRRADIEPGEVDSVLAGSMAQASIDAYLLPLFSTIYSEGVQTAGNTSAEGYGVRLVLTLARQPREGILQYGIATACIGGGQEMALLIVNPDYRKRGASQRLPPGRDLAAAALRNRPDAAVSMRAQTCGSTRRL